MLTVWDKDGNIIQQDNYTVQIREFKPSTWYANSYTKSKVERDHWQGTPKFKPRKPVPVYAGPDFYSARREHQAFIIERIHETPFHEMEEIPTATFFTAYNRSKKRRQQSPAARVTV